MEELVANQVILFRIIAALNLQILSLKYHQAALISFSLIALMASITFPLLEVTFFGLLEQASLINI
jgi:hypothetical protein